METSFTVLHISAQMQLSFEEFTSRFESAAGIFIPAVLNEVASDRLNTNLKIAAMEGREGLMIFSMVDHGLALELLGLKAKAKQYLIGNPLTAISMTKLDLRAALYAPLRILVYESSEKRTLVEYDLPSNLFGQFGINDVREVGITLDHKIANLISIADNPEEFPSFNSI